MMYICFASSQKLNRKCPCFWILVNNYMFFGLLITVLMVLYVFGLEHTVSLSSKNWNSVLSDHYTRFTCVMVHPDASEPREFSAASGPG